MEEDEEETDEVRQRCRREVKAGLQPKVKNSKGKIVYPLGNEEHALLTAPGEWKLSKALTCSSSKFYRSIR